MSITEPDGTRYRRCGIDRQTRLAPAKTRAVYIAKKAASGTVRLVEKLNLKTDSQVRDCILAMSDERLLVEQSATRRAVSSAVTGTLLSTTIAIVCPVFAVSAGINCWQIGISSTNRHRVRREVRRRKTSDEEFCRLILEKDHYVRDIVTGCMIKTVFTIAGAGIVGLEQIGANFAELTHHAAAGGLDVLASQHHTVVTAAADSTVHTALTPPDVSSSGADHLPAPTDSINNPGDTFQQDLNATSAQLGALDQSMHAALGGIGDETADGLATLTQWHVDSATSWAQLAGMVRGGADRAGLVLQVALVGAVSELAQPVVQVVEVAQDEARRWWREQRIRRWRMQQARHGENGVLSDDASGEQEDATSSMTPLTKHSSAIQRLRLRARLVFQ